MTSRRLPPTCMLSRPSSQPWMTLGGVAPMTKLKGVRPADRELSNRVPSPSQPVYCTVRLLPFRGCAPVPTVMSPYCSPSAVVVRATGLVKLSEVAPGDAVGQLAAAAAAEAPLPVAPGAGLLTAGVGRAAEPHAATTAARAVAARNPRRWAEAGIIGSESYRFAVEWPHQHTFVEPPWPTPSRSPRES